MADIDLENIANAIYESKLAKYRIGSNAVPIENGTKLIPISESTLNRIFDRHKDTGYIVVSANRSERPNEITGEIERTREDNIRALNELKLMIKSSKFGYIPLWGGFKENGQDAVDPEPSFMVFPGGIGGKEGNGATFEELLQFGMDVIKKFHQDSMMVCFPVDYQDPERAGKTAWITANDLIDATFKKDPVWNDKTQMYWSQDRRRGAGGYSQFKRWLSGRSPWERGSVSRRDEHGHIPMKLKDIPNDPERFSMEMESFQFFVEPPAATYNTSAMRYYTGYDTGIYKLLKE